MFTPILVYLSKYLYELYHFYQQEPSNFNNFSVQFITKFMIFFILKTSHVKLYLIKYNS